jgi:hypothetical protein
MREIRNLDGQENKTEKRSERKSVQEQSSYSPKQMNEYNYASHSSTSTIDTLSPGSRFAVNAIYHTTTAFFAFLFFAVVYYSFLGQFF